MKLRAGSLPTSSAGIHTVQEAVSVDLRCHGVRCSCYTSSCVMHRSEPLIWSLFGCMRHKVVCCLQ